MEEYKNIIGFSKYQVSNLGNVKSFQFKNEKILKTTINKKTGYVCLHLKDDNGTSKNITISEATIIGERVAAAIKSSPDLQNGFKKALNFTSNDRI